MNDHDFDISFNLYRLHEDKVDTKVITSDNTVSINRITSSVTICAQSQTNRPRNHETSYSLLLSMEKNNTQMHYAVMLDVGQFIYFNEEKFYNDKTPNEIANILIIDRNCLTGETFGKNGKLKIFTGQSHRTKYRALHWTCIKNCNASLTGFVKKHRFMQHIAKCIGGHVTSMNFNTIPIIEYFDSSEFKNTLLVSIVASFDTETCQNKDFTRRKNKFHTIYKSDLSKEAEMVLAGVVATVIVRPKRENDFTVYKDISMSDEELLYMDMIPFEIRKFIEVEDLEPVSSAIDHFRKSMDKFMFLNNEILGIYEEEKLKSIDKSEELEVNNKALMLCRLETSRRFGIYFMQFFQAAMED